MDWATTLSENLCDQLEAVKDKKKFYMMSYVVYLLAARATNYPGLYKKGNMQDPNAWPYIVYPQLVKKKLSPQSKEYRIVNDAFVFAIIRFIEGNYAKRLSDQAKDHITTIGAYFIQFRTFTYIRIGGASINPKKLPRYPSDKLVIMELSRQIESAYEMVKKQRRPCWEWSLTVGAYQVKRKQDIPTFGWEWENYPLAEYFSPRPYFDCVGKVVSLEGKDFYHEDAIEDHWMNATDDYDVCI